MDKGTYIVRVIAAVVDQQQLTLYRENGETIVIPQGDPRLAPILKAITPVLASGMPGTVAEVDIGREASKNPYRDFEQQNGPGIRFFRIAKAKLASFFSGVVKSVAPMELGVFPNSVATPDPIEPTVAEKLLRITDEIIAHAKSSHHPEFDHEDTNTGGDSTVVAVVDHKVVASVEKLKPQITRATKSSSSVGFSTFMARVAAITDTRRHSVEDLLTFLEKGDLPIANDGSVIIYKVLRWKDRKAGTYVDCHTGKIVQRVGSYIHMDPSLVDHDRRVECSNGLHVARRGYLSSFPGDVVVLAKVAPEDVIAVPLHDADKMRVCGYHILFELSDDAFQKLRQNQPFTDTDDARLLLGRAIAGDHPAPLENVRITEHKGGGVITTICDKRGTFQGVTVSLPAEALGDLYDTVQQSPSVNPRDVANQVAEVKEIAESRRAKAMRLLVAYKTIQTEPGKTEALQELVAFKKATKLGWIALGLSENEYKEIQNKLG